MPPAWPEDEYLVQLGKVVYSIASVEGLLIWRFALNWGA